MESKLVVDLALDLAAGTARESEQAAKSWDATH
jgi:hypothetical protein